MPQFLAGGGECRSFFLAQEKDGRSGWVEDARLSAGEDNHVEHLPLSAPEGVLKASLDALPVVEGGDGDNKVALETEVQGTEAIGELFEPEFCELFA